ncbi:hypothetical protein [Streptomyces sp. NPDC057854]
MTGKKAPWATAAAISRSPSFPGGTAAGSPMKAVEVAVRDASGLDNSLVGVALMRKAF